MCDFFAPTNRKQFTGFKVVAKNKKTGEYHSVLTGELYPLKGRIPVWTTQKCMIRNLYGDILYQGKGHQAWADQMVGRTSALNDKAGALDVKQRWNEGLGYYLGRGFVLVVVKVRLTVDLMEASYGPNQAFVGRKMKILEEV